MGKIRINKEAYSESSKKSVGHEFLGEFYEDIHYKCRKCHKPATFSAEEQKEAFEVRKEYMWARRVLCGVCWSEIRKIKSELNDKYQIYSQNKQAALRDKAFLENWLEALEALPKYGEIPDTAKINMVKNAIQNT